MRGNKIGFSEVAPIIPSKKKIYVVWLKISLQSSDEEKSTIKA
jgi:hypothetical protein